jgi:hypothetical protein
MRARPRAGILSGMRGLQPDEEALLLPISQSPPCTASQPRRGGPLNAQQVEIMFRLRAQGRLETYQCDSCCYTTPIYEVRVMHPRATAAGREALKLAAVLRYHFSG